jgi:branched-chain amino acid transport system substrate-binding protein
VTKFAFVGLLAAAGAVAGLPIAACAADVIKIGIIVPLTGPFFSTGQQIADAAKFYVQQHGDTVQGKKIELIIKDDGGNSELTRRVTQELLVNDKVQILGGSAVRRRRWWPLPSRPPPRRQRLSWAPRRRA